MFCMYTKCLLVRRIILCSPKAAFIWQKKGNIVKYYDNLNWQVTKRKKTTFTLIMPLTSTVFLLKDNCCSLLELARKGRTLSSTQDIECSRDLRNSRSSGYCRIRKRCWLGHLFVQSKSELTNHSINHCLIGSQPNPSHVQWKPFAQFSIGQPEAMVWCN